MPGHTCLVFEASRKWCHCHTISYMCRLCWWYKHVADVVPPSIALAFVTKMSEIHTSASPSAIQMKNWWKKFSTEEKLDIISHPEKAEWIADTGCNVRFAHCSTCTIHDSAEKITGSANENYMFNLCDIFQERNPGIHWDLAAYRNEAGEH